MTPEQEKIELEKFEEAYLKLFPPYKSAMKTAGLSRPSQNNHYKDCLETWLERARLVEEECPFCHETDFDL